MRRALPWLTGSVLLVVGSGVYLLAGPLPSRLVLPPGAERPQPTSWTVAWTAGQLVGAGLAVLGLLLLAGTAGRRLGRRGGAAWSWGAGLLGSAVVAAGVLLFRRANTAPPVGWFAYAPLQQPGASSAYTSTLTLTFDRSDELVLWSGQHALGAGLAVVGAALLAGVAGRLSRRPGSAA